MELQIVESLTEIQLALNVPYLDDQLKIPLK